MIPRVRERVEKLLAAHVRTWTVREVMAELKCSYDSAKTSLTGMMNAGTAHRRRMHGGHYVYWSSKHGDPGDE